MRAAGEASFADVRLALFGSWEVLKSRAAELGLPFEFERIPIESLAQRRESLPPRSVVDIPCGPVQTGVGSKTTGASAAQNVIECAAACRSRLVDAMVTAPLNKKHFQDAGFDFPGHTEFLAHLSGASEIAMAFLTDRLRVVLTTIHDPLRQVVRSLSSELVFRKLAMILTEFPRLGLRCDRVAVAGLNPHAGESGIMGSEDMERIAPAVLRAREAFPGAMIEGPLPGDTLFWRAYNGEFDVVLAMYHDQGLAPIKLIGFGESVNVTLGLPFIRTSVDHGTAFEIAGKGIARHDSMNSALRWAIRLIEGKRRSRPAL